MTALLFEAQRYSYAELASRAARCATLLWGASRVAVLGEVSPESVIDVWAALSVAPQVVLLHPKLSVDEQAEQLRALRPECVLRAGRIEHVEAQGGSGPEGVAFFTSGSSGAPKAALLSRWAILASAKMSADRLGLCATDRWLLSLPLAHVGGFSILARMARVQGTVVLKPPGPFDAVETLELVKRTRVTLMSVVPTMLGDLVALGPPPTSLRAILVGGAPLPTSMRTRALDLGWPIITTYGMTETASQVTLQTVAEGAARAPGEGRPLSGVELRVCRGHVQVRGPNLFSGYLTEAGLQPARVVNGWFDTQDLGALDEAGRLTVRGRASGLIITGGENVHPEEVESRLLLHPGIEAVCVFGVPDDRWGQRVQAAVVAPGLTEAALDEFCARSMAPHRRPRGWLFLPALPRLRSGKLDRRRILEMGALASLS